MAEDEAKALAEAKKLPLAERIECKIWKVRSEAFEDVRAACERAFNSSDPVIDEAGPLFGKGVGDANANGMDKALEALCAWLHKADESQAARLAPGVCATVAAKCLKARPATAAKAADACLLLVELEQQAAVVECVLKAFSDKVPKVALAAVDIVSRAVAEFGAKVVDPKPIMKALPAVFAHPNAGVRDKAKELSVELAACTGSGVVEATLLEKMNDAMRKDVEGAIAALPTRRKQPQRFTRRDAAARAAAAPAEHDGAGTGDEGPTAAGSAAALDNGQEAGGDPYDFAEPVDVLSQLAKAAVTVGDTSTPFWDSFDSSKWNVRKGALDKVRELARTPRLAPGDYGALVRELKKVLAKDANVNCAASAADATGALATGLRREFVSGARQLCPAVLERFREKNSVMSKAADDALRAMAVHCYALSDVADDLVVALAHKNPKVRLDTLRLLGDMVDAAERAQVARGRDVLLPAVTKLAPDADAGIREAAQGVLVAFALKLGSFSAIQPHLTKLGDQRSKLIEEAVMAAATGAKKAAPAGAGRPGAGGVAKAAPGKPAAPPPPPAAPPRHPSRTESSAAPKALGPKNGNVGRAGGGGGIKHAVARRGGGATEDEEAAASGGRLSAEELDQRMEAMFGAAAVEELRSPLWQARLEAMCAVAEQVAQSVGSVDCGAVIQCLARLPGWAEKNFQVVNKVFDIVALLARESPSFRKRDAAVAVEGLADKIHELKHRLQVCEALTAAAEAAGPQFVAAQLHRRAAANKNPKVLSEALAWVAQAVEDFGLAAMDLGAILQWTIADLGSPNAPIRNQAMAVLGRCHAQVGGGLLAQLSEALKPAQVTALEEIFRKNPQAPGFQPQRRVRQRRGRAAAPAGGAAGGGPEPMDIDGSAEEGYVEAGSLEDLLPRADISAALSGGIIARIGIANWKERNAALDEVEALLKEAGGRIQPDLPADLFPALRGRMADTNRNLAAKTLLLIAKLAAAVGPPFDRCARPVLVPALANLSDNKKQVRDAVVVMLDAWVGICPAERLFAAVADAVANPKCVVDGRVAALAWMARVLGEGKGEKCAGAALKAAVTATLDKAAAVREGGNALLAALAQAASGEEVQAALQALDPPQRKGAEPLVQKALAAAAPPAAPGGAGSRANGQAAVSRPSTTASAAASSVPRPALSVGTADSEAAPILAMSSTKAARSRQLRPRSSKFEPALPDELEALEAALGAVASEELRSLLFSKDFKDHVRAADALAAALPALLPEVAASLDLLLRWAAARLCDGNMQSLVRVLEALKSMLEALAGAEYEMTDAEAAALLPTVVEKSGHNQDRVRALHRDVLRAACALHPTAKVLEYVTQGLGSKNNRTRVECCEFVAAAVEGEGSGVAASCRAKPLPAIAALLKERDGGLRGAALAAIEAVWAQEGGEGLWKLLGRLEPREKEMVEDRLKRSSKAPRTTAAPPADENMRHASPAAEQDQYQYHGGDGVMAYARPAFTPPAALDMTPTPERPAGGNAAAAAAAAGAEYVAFPGAAAAAGALVPTPVPRGAPSTPAAPSVAAAAAAEDPAFQQRWEANLAAMASPSLPDAIDAIKQLCADVMLATDPSSGGATQRMRAVMGDSAPRLFATVNQQLGAIFEAAEAESSATGAPPSSRGCKYALNVMLQGMGVAEIARGLPQATLRESISLLLLRMLDDKGLLRFDEGPTLVRAVNVLMLRMLEASNRTYAFAALLQLLREPPAGVDPGAVPKFNDLVVKCLIKLTKSLQGSMEGVDLSSLLLNLHDFFMFLGVDEIRKRSSSDDKPLRMVKTILHELCKMEGHGIYASAAGIPGRHANPQPIIFAYIQLNLASLQQSGLIAAESEAEAERGDRSGAGSATAAASAAAAAAKAAKESAAADAQVQKAEVKQRLKDIMTHLVQRDPALQEAAMVDLYRLRSEHPSYVDKYIAGTSDMFRRFIDTGLARLDAAGGVASLPPAAAAAPRAQGGSSPAAPPGLQSPAAGGFGSAVSVGGEHASLGPEGTHSRLNSLRERMARASTEGAQLGVGGGSLPPTPGNAGGVPPRFVPGGDLAPPPPRVVSIEELTARMQALRRPQH